VRVKQAGATVGFLLVAITLVLVLVGGLYVVRRQSVAPVATQAASDSPQVGAPSAAPQTGDAQGESGDSSEVVAVPELPKTGPETSSYGMSVLGLLTFVGVRFVRSRRVDGNYQ